MQGEKVIYVVVLILFFIAAFFCGLHYHKPDSPTIIVEKGDTTYITKTVTEYLISPAKVEYKEHIRVEYQTDTLIIRDTVTTPIFIHDTLYMPMSTYYFEAVNGKARMWTTGYNVTLDKFELDETVKIVNNRKRLSGSVGTGAGVIYSPFHNNIDAGVGIFGGLTYNF